MTTTTTRMPPPVPAPTRADAPSCGLPADQVHQWLEHVQDDLRRVRARLEYLRAEQARLENQQHLLAELLAASSAV
jgi:hypothetical protein